MSFRTNDSQQMSLSDSTYGLTERELKFLRRSWAEDFANHIFPNIDESIFSVLYSENEASKPNAPVNVILGLLILKERFGLTDEECLEQMLFNAQFQYALRTSSLDEQPINENTLGRFRARVAEYEESTGDDLVKKAFNKLTEKMQGIMGIDPSLKRMDSGMIASGFRRMSRLNIMRETLRMTARLLKESGRETRISEKYGDGAEPTDAAYRLRSGDIPAKMEQMLGDAAALLAEYPDCLRGSEAFAALKRMIDDQSKMAEDGRILKEGREISPDSMQTPYEQDATYRKKAGKQHVGFVANFVETCDGENNLITDYDLQQNTYSDMQFAKDVLGELPDGGGDTEKILVDGAFASTETLGMAEEKGVELVPTSIAGGLNGTFEAGFEIDDDGMITQCPEGHSPIDARRADGSHQAHFDAEICADCPNCERCPGVFQVRAALIVVTDAALEKAELAEMLGTEQAQGDVNKRNGIEGVPSLMRRRYRVDEMRDKGLVRKRHRLGIKIMAANLGRLVKWRKDVAKSTFAFLRLPHSCLFYLIFSKSAQLSIA